MCLYFGNVASGWLNHWYMFDQELFSWLIFSTWQADNHRQMFRLSDSKMNLEFPSGQPLVSSPVTDWELTEIVCLLVGEHFFSCVWFKMLKLFGDQRAATWGLAGDCRQPSYAGIACSHYNWLDACLQVTSHSTSLKMSSWIGSMIYRLIMGFNVILTSRSKYPIHQRWQRYPLGGI